MSASITLIKAVKSGEEIFVDYGSNYFKYFVSTVPIAERHHLVVSNPYESVTEFLLHGLGIFTTQEPALYIMMTYESTTWTLFDSFVNSGRIKRKHEPGGEPGARSRVNVSQLDRFGGIVPWQATVSILSGMVADKVVGAMTSPKYRTQNYRIIRWHDEAEAYVSIAQGVADIMLFKVKKKHRMRGVGKLFVKFIEGACQKCGCHQLVVCVSDKNAGRFLGKLGFSRGHPDRAVIMFSNTKTWIKPIAPGVSDLAPGVSNASDGMFGTSMSLRPRGNPVEAMAAQALRFV
jgi:GNAT superfamily N-acetyltransferase